MLPISTQPRPASVPEVLRGRAARVLEIAAAHRHRRLILGAWGCGVFRNDPAQVAATFAGLLGDRPGWFDQVTFAVHDDQPATPTFTAFTSALAPASSTEQCRPVRQRGCIHEPRT